jgi:hypothetical protein
LLIRVYGEASGIFYNPDEELEIFKMLAHYR